MNKIWREIVLLASKVNSDYLGIVLFLLALTLFVAAAGAPEGGGTSIR